MSERETACRPINRAADVLGVAASGRRTRAEMIAQFRSYHKARLLEARRALAMTDEELIVETYLGPYAQRRREEVTE